MKATGIVRRIDDLGRVVVPKEIRRTMRIREGDPLEIFTNKDGEVIFKKYSPMGEISEFSGQYSEVLSRTSGMGVLITDRDQVIAVAGGSKKEYLNQSIGAAAEKVMEERKAVTVSDTGIHALFRSTNDNGIERTLHTQIMAPIIAEGDPIGMVIIASKENTAKLGELELKLGETAASFLAKQMEQ